MITVSVRPLLSHLNISVRIYVCVREREDERESLHCVFCRYTACMLHYIYVLSLSHLKNSLNVSVCVCVCVVEAVLQQD